MEAQARQLLLLPEPELYHPPQLDGYFALMWQAPKGEAQQLSLLDGQASPDDSPRMHQEFHPVKFLPYVVEHLNTNRDTWISQGRFFKRSRKVVHLWQISVCFLDLDTYKRPQLAGRTPETNAHIVRQFCSDEGIPQPSVILFSGRGLQLKWLLDRPLPRPAVIRWNTVQAELVRRFSNLGADPAARDASRVLRLDRTVNTKSGEIVRVVDVLEAAGAPVRYDFEILAREVLPFAREELKEKRKLKVIQGGGRRNASRPNWREYSWTVVEDLRTLAKVRGWETAGVPEGSRDLYTFWTTNYLLLSGATNSHQMFSEARALARDICPGWNAKIENNLSTLFRKARAHEAGETVEIGGRRITPIYTPKAAHLVDLFQITSEEQQRMRALIDSDHKKERKRQEERERSYRTGKVKNDWETHVAKRQEQATERQSEAIRLQQEGKNKSEIAKILGVARRTVIRWLGCDMASATTMA